MSSLREAPIQLMDTHAHLNFEPLFSNIDGVLDRARAAGVQTVVVPAYDGESWATVWSLSARHNVFGAYGLHPWKAADSLDTSRLTDFLHHQKAVAVGEIGLDFRIDAFDKTQQIDVFTRQLDVAAALQLPVLLHCRGAFMEMLEILKSYKGQIQGVVHAFSKGPELATEFVRLGLHIAFGGAITRQTARRARQSAQLVPVEHIVLETDCPSIGLEGVDPENTEPCHVARIAAELASLKGMSIAEVARITTDNGRRLFSLPGQ